MTPQRPALSVCLILSAAAVATGQTLSVNGEAPPASVSVGAATNITLAVSNGPGNPTDWVALYPAGAPDNAYLGWSYLNGTAAPPSSGLTSASFTAYAPLAAGAYEWRLFANNGWTPIATSSAVTVSASSAVMTVNGVVPPAGASVGAGSQVTVTLVDGPGNPTDWIGLSLAGAPDTTLLDWRYLTGTTVPPSTGQASGTVHFLAPAAPGSYEVRLFAHNTFGRLATSAISVSTSTAALTVNDMAPPTAVSVNAGTYVSVGVTGGPAQPGDWVGLYAVNGPDSAYLGWKYLNGSTTMPSIGVADSAVTFVVPIAAGSYEFRLFNANTFTRLANSTTMVVSASTSSLSVNGVSAPNIATAVAGSQAAIGVAGGPSNVGDWVGLYRAGEPDSALLDWRYLNDTAQLPGSAVTTATLHFGVPTPPGTYEFRFFTDNSYDRLATSGPVVVPATVAQILINGVAPPTAVTVEPGATVTVGITGGPANPTDWVALAVAGSPDTSYSAWQYLNGSTAAPSAGLAIATLSFAIPSTPGTYELRLFAHNGYQRITTSAPITASTEPSTVSIALTSPFPGTTFNAPSILPLSASASISGGTISRVDFYAGTTIVGSASAPPYQTTWVTPPQGAHALTAVAVDSTNAVTTSAPIAITIAPAGSGEGSLGAPIANPPSGVYGTAQVVTLSAMPGATIRYTTDGTAPWTSSPTYTTPLTVTELTTIRSVAFLAGWTPSPEAFNIYHIDTTAPTIVATLTPAANPAGWNRTPVTVSFECFDESAVASCPAPVVVAQDGAGQLVTVTAVDALGFQRDLTVTVNIDSQPPVIALTSPTANVSTSDATIALNGSVTDSGAGLMSTSCNRQWANPTSGTFSCTVSLAPGRNTILASAVDLAGNSASAGITAIRVTPPTKLSISPTTVALAIGDEKVLTVTTDAGLPATGLTWASNNPSVVAIGPDNDGTITAETLGIATVTASAGGLTAEATVRVLPGGVALGEAIWTTTPTSGLSFQNAFRANPVQDDDPDLFTVEAENYASTSLLVKAIRGADGATLWTQSVASPYAGYPAEQPVPDAFGGLLVKSASGFVQEYPEVPAGALRRIGNDVVPPWEYVSEASIGSVASAPDGTVYLIEYGIGSRATPRPSSTYPTYNGESFIVGLDGRTGQVKFRVPMPTGRFVVSERTNRPDPQQNEDDHRVEPLEHCQAANFEVRDGGYFGSIAVLENGDAFVQQTVQDYQNTSPCPYRTTGTASVGYTLRLWQVTANGVATSRILANWSGTFPTNPDGGFDNVGQEDFFEGVNRPDGRGGVLASWTKQVSGGTDEQRLTQVSAAGGLTSRLDPAQGSSIMVTSLGTAFLQEPDAGLMARDTHTWAPLWQAPLAVTPVQALDDGGLVVLGYDEDFNPLLQQVDAAGVIVQSERTTVYAPFVIFRDSGVLHGFNVGGGLEMIRAYGSVLDAQFVYDGGAFSQCKVTKLNYDLVMNPPRQIGLVPNRGVAYTYEFVDDGEDTADAARWRANVKIQGVQVGDQQKGVRDAFQIWTDTSLKFNLGYSFAEAQADDETPDIIVRKGDLTQLKFDSQGRGIAGYYKPNPMLPNRRALKGIISLTSDEQVLLTETGYLKATLHEIGHALGLAHPWGLGDPVTGNKPKDFPQYRRETVMNNLGFDPAATFLVKRDDSGSVLPLHPTKCDVIGVGIAKTK